MKGEEQRSEHAKTQREKEIKKKERNSEWLEGKRRRWRREREK